MGWFQNLDFSKRKCIILYLYVGFLVGGEREKFLVVSCLCFVLLFRMKRIIEEIMKNELGN